MNLKWAYQNNNNNDLALSTTKSNKQQPERRGEEELKNLTDFSTKEESPVLIKYQSLNIVTHIIHEDKSCPRELTH